MTYSLTAVLILAWLAGPALADDISVESAPPVVVQTVPAAGTSDLDPATTQIHVTFSKDMADGTWSWSTVSQDSFPEVNGKTKYLDDHRTCVLPVKLAPGKTYGIWVNSENFKNFQDADGRAAVPYLLIFATKK